MNGRQTVTHIVCTNQVVGKNLWMMDFVRKPCVETVLRCTSTITGLNIQRFETRKFTMIIENIAKGTTDPRVEFILPK